MSPSQEPKRWLPQDHDEYRCKAVPKNLGRRCGKIALKNSNFCQFHGGRNSHGRTDAGVNMPMFYSKYLDASISDLVAAQMGSDPRETLNLFEELALMRLACGDAVALWTAAQQSTDSSKRVAASMIMADALKNVQQLCQAAASIESQGKDKFSVHTLRSIINQIVRIAYRVFEDDMEKAQAFEQMIADHVKLPSLGHEGTSLTPDMDVGEMDSSVPQA